MAAIHVAALLSHPAVRSAIERALAARGNRGDTMIAHIDPREAAMLRFMGGVGTINPRTGLRQFYDPDAPGHDTPGVSGGGVGGGVTDNSGLGQGVSGQGGSGGSGLGAGGGHSGEGGYWSTGGGYNRLGTTPQNPPSYAPAAPINNMPAAPPPLTPMMSSTATTDLTGGRFGALPSWATTPYQIGMAPSSYPTPGVNAALGAPGTGGGGLPGGGGGGLPGGAGGGGNLAGAGGGVTPIGTPIGSYQPVRTPGGVGVQIPGTNTVALLGYGAPGTTPKLPNGQSLQQYLGSLMLGLHPQMPGAPTASGITPSASQPVANQLATTAQAAPQATPQLHPVVQQALAQGILGGGLQIQTPAQKTAYQRLIGTGRLRNQ